MSAALWADAVTAALLFAVDPPGTGILLRARAGSVRERWLEIVKTALPASEPFRHLPAHIEDGRLLGGLDLDATLRLGKPVAERGLLAQAHGGVLVAGMAERLPPATIAHLTTAMDRQSIRIERDGISAMTPTRFGVIALDEGLEDEAAPDALADRIALRIDLAAVTRGDTDAVPLEFFDIAAARTRLPAVSASDDSVETLCNVAAALGITSLRAPLHALQVARCAAALAGRDKIDQDDLACAARLVLAPRATVAPQPQDASADPPKEQDNENDSDNGPPQPDIDRALDEMILAAAQAAIPADVLAALRAGPARQRGRGAGKSGAIRKSKSRGRPTGTRRGDLRSGNKLNLIATLRAAAPWQRLRRSAGGDASRVIVHADDFRITRFRQRSETATIFVVDASGSAALHRLAEAKGAVELLLADCYVRRDQVALIAFRGAQAELLLPPTRSLTRAKRSLAGLPGGGGTPLAAGLDAAFVLADAVQRKGQTPSVVVLTDGRANIARDGAPGRPRAELDALAAARALRAAGIATVLVDTSPRPGPAGAQLASEMGARYLPLPYADAAVVSNAVKAVVN